MCKDYYKIIHNCKFRKQMFINNGMVTQITEYSHNELQNHTGGVHTEPGKMPGIDCEVKFKLQANRVSPFLF